MCARGKRATTGHAQQRLDYSAKPRLLYDSATRVTLSKLMHSLLSTGHKAMHYSLLTPWVIPSTTPAASAVDKSKSKSNVDLCSAFS